MVNIPEAYSDMILNRAVEAVPRGPCSPWPKTAEGLHQRAGYRAALDGLKRVVDAFEAAGVAHPVINSKLALLVEAMLEPLIAAPTATGYQRGFREALLWYWTNVLEQDDTGITVQAKSLLYPEPMMGS